MHNEDGTDKEFFSNLWKLFVLREKYHFWVSTSYLRGELLGLLVYQPMHYDLSSLEVGKFKLHASFSLGLLVSDENICSAPSLSFKYLGASWLQAQKPANLQKNQ